MPLGSIQAAASDDRRQRALESLQLPEHQPDERFDRITRLARTVFGVPMTTITILDGDRAWFPSAQGFDAIEMPRKDTFCDRTTQEDRVIVVEDATLDERFDHLPVVRDGAVRFYAGHPLRDSLDNVIGTFCLFDAVPRRLDAEHLVAFTDLAFWAEQELVRSAEMTHAGNVQASLLPARAFRNAEWEVTGFCLPALAVGGDFYDYDVTDDVLHLSLGDVMGKGTGAALLGAGVRSAIRGTNAAVTAGVDLGVTATQVARSMRDDLGRAESFVTLFELAVDLADGSTRYVDAGSGLCLLLGPDGLVTRLGSHDRPFGVLDDDHWTEHETVLSPGSRLLVFSDGLLDLVEDPMDWVGPIGEMMRTADNIDALVAQIADLARDRIALDDVTVVAVFRQPAPGPAQ